MPNFSLIIQEWSTELGRYVEPALATRIEWIDMIITEFPSDEEIDADHLTSAG